MEKTIFIEFLLSETRYINSLKKKKLDQCFLRLLGFFFYITGAVSRLYPPTPPFSLKKKPQKNQKKTKKKPKKKTKKKQLDLPIANKMHLIRLGPRDAGIWPGRHVK